MVTELELVLIAESDLCTCPLCRDDADGTHEWPCSLLDSLLFAGGHRLRHRRWHYRLQQMARTEPETFLLTRGPPLGFLPPSLLSGQPSDVISKGGGGHHGNRQLNSGSPVQGASGS